MPSVKYTPGLKTSYQKQNRNLVKVLDLHTEIFLIYWVKLLVLFNRQVVSLWQPPWTVAHQARLSMGFSRQEYWSGLPFPSPGDLLDLGIEPDSPVLAGRFFTTEPPGKPLGKYKFHCFKFFLM